MFRRAVSLLIAMALALVCLGSGAADPKDEAQKALDRVLPELNFNQVPLRDVIEFIGDITKTKIDVNWDAFDKAGVSSDQPVTLRVKNLKLSGVFDELFSKLEAKEKLAYKPDQDTIRVSTAEDLGMK